jgi:hypothetical protein
MYVGNSSWNVCRECMYGMYVGNVCREQQLECM